MTRTSTLVRVGQVWANHWSTPPRSVRIVRVELALGGRLTYVLVDLLGEPTWARTQMWFTMSELERMFVLIDDVS